MQVVTHYFSSVGLFNLCIFSMLIVMVASRSLLRMEQIPGKGRGLVASQPLKAGQIVLTESPLILYSASPLLTPSSSPYTYCDHCFRILPLTHNSTTVTCPSCSNHSFCSQKCFSLALKSSHSTWVCKPFNNTPIQHFFNNTPRTPSPSPFNCCFSQPLPS